MNSILPWVEKYRPLMLEDVSSHTHIISTLSKFIESGKLPHLLFYGPPGTGKTTTILACARKLFGSSPEAIASHVLELNASDDRGIDVIREQVKTFASTKNIFSISSDKNHPGHCFKLIILDEADSMTNAAQDALRRVIEKYVKHVRFCLICNDISKITSAIQSRCTLFRFSPIPEEHMMHRLEHVIEYENITATSDGKRAILKISKGDMRRLFNVLQSTATAHNKIVDEDNVYACTMLPNPKHMQSLLYDLLNCDFDACYTKLNVMRIEHGYSLADILQSISELFASINLPNNIQIYAFDKLSQLESCISAGGNEAIYAGGLVGIFQLVRGIASNGDM